MSTAELIVDESPPSQFLPGTKIQYAWDSTSLGDLKKCPRYYQYIHIEGWYPKDESIHLRFGIEYHQALYDYESYKQQVNNDHEEALRFTVKHLLLRLHNSVNPYKNPAPDDKPSVRVKTKLNLVRTVVWYLDEFKHDVTETVPLRDETPAMEVSFRFELDWGPGAGKGIPGYPNPPYVLCGHLDRIVTFNSEQFVQDHKTATTTLTPYYFQQYEPNNQMTLYTLAGQVVLGTSIAGVIIDAATVQVQGSWFQRGITYRTQGQLDEWLGDLRVLLAQAEAYATAGHWPMNDTACSMYGGCRFREICSKDPRVRPSFLKASFVRKPEAERWNPLKPR